MCLYCLQGFHPPSDLGQTAIKLELQPGSTLEDTRLAADKARSLVADIPEVTHIFTSVGSFSGDGANVCTASADIRKATLTVNLTHRSERQRKQTEIETDIRHRLERLPGARYTVGLGGEKCKLS